MKEIDSMKNMFTRPVSRNQLLLGFYDLLILLFVESMMLIVYRGQGRLDWQSVVYHAALAILCIFPVRIIGGVYKQVWRYGGMHCFIRLLFVDGCAFCILAALERIPVMERISFTRLLSIFSINLLFTMAIRMAYVYAYLNCMQNNARGRFLRFLLRQFSGHSVNEELTDENRKTRTAILGADNIGATLAVELANNEFSEYSPCCFVSSDPIKIGREIQGLMVYEDNDQVFAKLEKLDIESIILALPSMSEADQITLANRYLSRGYAVKVYDSPEMRSANGKRRLREFEIDDLLFRKPIRILNSQTEPYYRNKTILVTGAGGSIGSELCRQLAEMKAGTLILLDIYENGVYDLQQELKRVFPGIQSAVEIVSVTNRAGLERVFETYHPQIVVHAAAHKHVPLMEHNCIEAVENNVMGTAILAAVCEKYHAERLMMVSTDKAVNPTNVMGATKRLCEMIVLSAGAHGTVKCSATRFGNVLGSAGSVIPLFKKQIAAGGPVTITDRRIIRYFMTIPEAVNLVLESGAMAQNGELFVLDMGQPVKILDLAENMIRLSGAREIKIVETGLRPGEKLYEELLIQTETLKKTSNNLIYVETDAPCDPEAISAILKRLRDACATGDDDYVRDVLKAVVPTYRAPEEVNSAAAAAM